ncbi:MAG: MauE/DoxX family redox-associated membrane protein [Bacteroidota bacterium]
MKKRLPPVLGLILLASAIGHLVNPDFYAAMIPPFIPASLANILATITEAGVGILLLLPRYRHWGGLGFILLMLAFLPIHVWDLFREDPAIGPAPAPLIRLLLQFLLIYAGYWVYRNNRP